MTESWETVARDLLRSRALPVQFVDGLAESMRMAYDAAPETGAWPTRGFRCMKQANSFLSSAKAMA